MRYVLALIVALFSASAHAQCLDEGRLGVARTLSVDTRGGLEYGSLQYPGGLGLQHKEIIFTFDDGPNPNTTPRVLDILDHHCVKATFFLVGRYADAYPDLVREIAARGHTIASHTYSHPLLHRISFEAGLDEIERGEQAINRALSPLGLPVAPFFRFPGLNDTQALRAELAARDIAVMSCDFGADDWRRISPDEVHRRALRNIEARGSGMIILHDTQARTVEALPRLLESLSARNYRIVHIVPASSLP